MTKKEEKKSERTDEELAEKLREVYSKNSWVMTTPGGREINDNEWMHIDADDLLIDFLEQLWYTKTVNQYKEMRINFRYA